MSLALSCVNLAKKVHLFVSLASSRIDSSLQRVVSGSEDRKLKTPGLLGCGKKVFNRMVAFGSTQAGSMALTGLSTAMRGELMKDKIAITTVSPGLMRTGSPFNAWFKGRHREEFAWFAWFTALFFCRSAFPGRRKPPRLSQLG